jgi:hypothetical protein
VLGDARAVGQLTYVCPFRRRRPNSPGTAPRRFGEKRPRPLVHDSYCNRLLVPRGVTVLLDTVVGIATVLGVVGALAFNFVQMLRTRNQTRDAAMRAENAAALTIEYSERQLDALTEISRSIRDGGPARVPVDHEPRGVRWSLRHHSGDSYILTNEGDEPANSVEIHTDESLWHEVISGQETLAPGEAIHFMAAPSLATRDSTVTVTWVEPGETEPAHWRYPLPARPPR